ncbi:MAG: hypothetical protein DBX61_04655 [Clostridiales bacterium]|nr:MAG: hypothetical protein DBX61_04655 [Clostridiales bacterium]
MGELQSGSDNERIDEICHLTRVAISETENEDDLQPEILRHLEECEKCRSFREQNKKMLDALSQLSPGFLSKNGIGLADSVMEEVRKRKAFAPSSSSLNRRMFRHVGLAAACIVLLVASAPILLKMLEPFEKTSPSDAMNSSSAPMSYNDSTMTEDGVDFNYSDVEESEIVDGAAGSSSGELFDSSNAFNDDSYTGEVPSVSEDLASSAENTEQEQSESVDKKLDVNTQQSDANTNNGTKVNASVGSAGGSSEFLNRFSNETDKQGKSSTSLKNSNDVALQNKDSVSSNFVAPPASNTLILGSSLSNSYVLQSGQQSSSPASVALAFVKDYFAKNYTVYEDDYTVENISTTRVLVRFKTNVDKVEIYVYLSNDGNSWKISTDSDGQPEAYAYYLED